MSLFVLDTDLLTLLELNHPTVVQHVAACSPQELAITVITVEEKLTGWYSVIRKAKTPEKLLHGYRRLAEAVEMVKPLRILPYSERAYRRYEQLRNMKLGVAKMDLAIAAITLENTRNWSRAMWRTSAKFPD